MARLLLVRFSRRQEVKGQCQEVKGQGQEVLGQEQKVKGYRLKVKGFRLKVREKGIRKSKVKRQRENVI